MPVEINGNDLTLEKIQRVAVSQEKVSLTLEARKRVIKCRKYVDSIIKQKRTVYGLTTGFGKLTNIRIPSDQIDELQKNLILSHSTGVGKPLSISETRAVMLLRANMLAKGFSGIRIETLELLIELLNLKVHPLIPEKGSVGASGDLAPLSHLALILIGEGKAEHNQEILSGSEALKRVGLKPIILKAKEGLALNNGTQAMTGLAVLSYLRAVSLCKTADISAAMSLDAMLASPQAFDPLIHRLRPHPGQLISAQNIEMLLQNSELRDSHLNCEEVQDAYSLRCTAQVNGAVRDALKYVENILKIEINSVTDNPLIFPEADKVLSGGNFHGEPLAFAGDVMSFTVSELGNIAERRCEQILNPALNRGLKPFLAPRPGLDSGFMIAQLTAAALISENKVLAHPASVDSIPTSANQEDHVSMGMTSILKTRQVIDNTEIILGIELMIAAQALENRAYKSSPILEKIKLIIREQVATLGKDRILNTDIETMKKLVNSGLVVNIAQDRINLQ